MASFYFKAVASDGKLRTGTLSGETERAVAAELRRQGLVPVYVGAEPKKGFRLQLPVFAMGRRKDVLFFTQEISTLLKAGVPLDRSLSITVELTERPAFRNVAQDVLRVLKGGKSLAESLGTHPEYFSDLYLNMVRAGEASGALAAVFERLTEFESSRDELQRLHHFRDDLPVAAEHGGTGLDPGALNFVAPRFAAVFEQSHMAIPTATRIMLGVSEWLRGYGWMLAAGPGGRRIGPVVPTSAHSREGCGGTLGGFESPCWAPRCAKPRRRGSRGRWPPWWPMGWPWCSRSRLRARP